MGEVKSLQAFKARKKPLDSAGSALDNVIQLTIHPRNRSVARILRRLARRLEREPMARFDEQKTLDEIRI